MKYLILLLTSIIALSCSDGQIIFPIAESTIGVKSKIFYPSLESNQIMRIEDFEYNQNGQLQKKIYYGGDREINYNYELFIYDNHGNPIHKLDYHNNKKSTTGYNLLDSTIYFYSDNLLIAENVTYPLAHYYEKYIYEYDGKHLIKKTMYHNEDIDSYITYEYKDGKILKEKYYNKDNNITLTIDYKYKDAALIEIVYYRFGNEVVRRIEYSYNEFGKISVEKVDELLMYSSTLPYVVKYVY
jgi:hypothetical protein